MASSFSHKPYFFNRGNLERYSNGSFCRSCPLSEEGCPFEASYDQLEAELFKPMPSLRAVESNNRQRNNPRPSGGNAALSRPSRRP